MKYAERMSEARVRGAGVDEFTEAELPYSAQALKGRRLNDAPQHALKPIALIKFDEVVNRVPNPLALEFRHEVCSIYVLLAFQDALGVKVTRLHKRRVNRRARVQLGKGIA